MQLWRVGRLLAAMVPIVAVGVVGSIGVTPGQTSGDIPVTVGGTESFRSLAYVASPSMCVGVVADTSVPLNGNSRTLVPISASTGPLPGGTVTAPQSDVAAIACFP